MKTINDKTYLLVYNHIPPLCHILLVLFVFVWSFVGKSSLYYTVYGGVAGYCWLTSWGVNAGPQSFCPSSIYMRPPRLT
jgi:hypothetical protein